MKKEESKKEEKSSRGKRRRSDEDEDIDVESPKPKRQRVDVDMKDGEISDVPEGSSGNTGLNPQEGSPENMSIDTKEENKEEDSDSEEKPEDTNRRETLEQLGINLDKYDEDNSWLSRRNSPVGGRNSGLGILTETIGKDGKIIKLEELKEETVTFSDQDKEKFETYSFPAGGQQDNTDWGLYPEKMTSIPKSLKNNNLNPDNVNPDIVKAVEDVIEKHDIWDGGRDTHIKHLIEKTNLDEKQDNDVMLNPEEREDILDETLGTEKENVRLAKIEYRKAETNLSETIRRNK